MKYDLGAGKTRTEGFVSVDISGKCDPDIITDITKFPWDWAKDCDYIRADNIMEHIEPNKFIEVMNEAHRVMKPGGIIWIRVPCCRPEEPFWDACFRDPTHIAYFTEKTFDYWDTSDNEKYPTHARWENFGKDYGIIPWKRIRQKVIKPFLIIELMKV
jgi:SAM-dependent methyltransferase